jgi:hypothetical protein
VSRGRFSINFWSVKANKEREGGLSESLCNKVDKGPCPAGWLVTEGVGVRMWLQLFLCSTTAGLSLDGNAEKRNRREILQPRDWRGILKLRAKMKLYSLLGGFIAVCDELNWFSGLRNREAALTSINKAPRRSVGGRCRIIQVNIFRSELLPFATNANNIMLISF